MADLTVDVDGLDASQQLLRDNIRRYLAGEPLRFVCDKRLGY